MDFWSRERGLERISAAYAHSFNMHLKEPHAHWEMIQALENRFRVEECSFNGILRQFRGPQDIRKQESGRERIPYLLTCILYQRKGFHLDPVSFILSAFALDRMVAAILQHRCLYFLPGNYFQRARTSCCINLYLPRQNVPFYHQLGELPCHSAPGRQPSR